MDNDRRDYIRVKHVNDCILYVDGEEINAKTLDISETGISIKLDAIRHFDITKNVKIVIFDEVKYNKTTYSFYTRATVRHCNNINNQTVLGMSIVDKQYMEYARNITVDKSIYARRIT